jgi:hypothetical protein
MIENNQSNNVRAKLARVWREHTTMIPAKVKPKVVTPIGVVLLKVPAFAIPLKVSFEVADGEWAFALLISVHTPPDTMLVLGGERRALDIQ